MAHIWDPAAKRINNMKEQKNNFDQNRKKNRTKQLARCIGNYEEKCLLKILMTKTS